MKNTILEFQITGETAREYTFVPISSGNYASDPNYTGSSLKEMLTGNISVEDGSFWIKKVRRESDKEEFSVGVNVMVRCGCVSKISKFYYNEKTSDVFVNIEAFPEKYIFRLDRVKKIDSIIAEREIKHRIRRQMHSLNNLVKLLKFLTGNTTPGTNIMISKGREVKISTGFDGKNPFNDKYTEFMNQACRDFDEKMMDKALKNLNKQPILPFNKNQPSVIFFGTPGNMEKEKESFKELFDTIYQPIKKGPGLEAQINKGSEYLVNPEFSSNEHGLKEFFKKLYGDRKEVNINASKSPESPKPYYAVKEIKFPLMESETGIHMFEGDDYYTVCIKSIVSENWVVNGPFKLTGKRGTENIKIFANKDEAEEWIIQNKPMFSMKDVLSLSSLPTKFIRNEAKKKLDSEK